MASRKRRKVEPGSSVASVSADDDNPDSYSNTTAIVTGLSGLLEDTALLDVTLVFEDGEKLRAHRAVLAAISSVFRAMFTAGFRESKQDQVQIHDCNAVTFKKFMKFCYSGSISLSVEDVGEIATVADQFGVIALRDLCLRFIKDKISMETACKFMHLAMAVPALEGIEDECARYIADNASSIFNDRGFLLLSEEILMRILQKDELDLDETDIFRSCLKWAEHQASKVQSVDLSDDESAGSGSMSQIRKDTSAKFARLAPFIRFENISAEVLANEVEKTGIVPNEVLLEAYKKIALVKSVPQSAGARRSIRGLKSRRKREGDYVKEHDSTSVPDNECWYVIDSVWLETWRNFAFAGMGEEPPGPIANDRLLQADGTPRPNLVKAKHYRGINRTVWEFLHDKYGGGPVIARTALDIYSNEPANAG